MVNEVSAAIDGMTAATTTVAAATNKRRSRGARGESLADRLRAARLPEPAERRAIRRRAGATLRDIAEEVGVSTTAVSRWEQGAEKIRRDHRIAYARILDSLRTLDPVA